MQTLPRLIESCELRFPRTRCHSSKPPGQETKSIRPLRQRVTWCSLHVVPWWLRLPSNFGRGRIASRTGNVKTIWWLKHITDWWHMNRSITLVAWKISIKGFVSPTPSPTLLLPRTHTSTTFLLESRCPALPSRHVPNACQKRWTYSRKPPATGVNRLPPITSMRRRWSTLRAGRPLSTAVSL